MSDKEIVLASNNTGKVKEINALLASHELTVIPQQDFSVEDAIENGLSFIENAIIKARHAARKTSLPSIADDSGLEVSALNGQPGIYSARYAGAGASDETNLQKLINEIKNVSETKRHARFVCVMVYVRHANDPVPIISQGFWEGEIIDEPRGENGFGYDPIFFLPDRGCTSAELESSVKNKLSHRGQALRGLVPGIIKLL